VCHTVELSVKKGYDLNLMYPTGSISRGVFVYYESINRELHQISANVSSTGIYFYNWCENYCSVFVPGRSRVVQKLNNNSYTKCKSKSPKTTRLPQSVVKIKPIYEYYCRVEGSDWCRTGSPNTNTNNGFITRSYSYSDSTSLSPPSLELEGPQKKKSRHRGVY
jgi:hypothetical protein